jgi:O-antigen/teichoic acid export membrane protein
MVHYGFSSWTRRIGQLARGSGINAPLALGVATRIWNAASWLITLRLIVATLSPAIQGYYFTFTSLSQMSQLVDLGLQVLIVQFASHETLHLKFGRKGKITGREHSVARLVSLGRFSLSWYTVGSMFMVPALMAAGPWLFGRESHGPHWSAPWNALCVLVAVDLILNNFVWLLEGTNNLTVVYSYRLLRGFLMAGATWVFLELGFELWAIPLGLLAAVMVMATFLLSLRSNFVFAFFRRPARVASISWRKEIMPLQLRLGVSMISGFSTYYLLIPITFKFAGPVAAGKLGFTWTLIQGMASVAFLLPAIKFPTMGALASQRNWAALDRVTFRAGMQAMMLTVTGAVAIIVFAVALNLANSPLADRLLGVVPLTILSLSTLPFICQSVLVCYLRAHRQEPTALVAAVSTPLMLAVFVIGARLYGAPGVAIGYSLAMTFGVLPATVWLVIRYRKTWHIKDGPRSESESLPIEPVSPHVSDGISSESVGDGGSGIYP